MSHETPPETRDFRAFYEQLEAENPELVEARQVEENAEAFTQSVRDQLLQARGNMTQAEVAQRMGLKHQSRVSRIERGEGDLTLEAIYRYAKAIGMKPKIELVPEDAKESPEEQVSAAVAEALSETKANLEEVLDRFNETIKNIEKMQAPQRKRVLVFESTFVGEDQSQSKGLRYKASQSSKTPAAPGRRSPK